jgi:hypothetical protein
VSIDFPRDRHVSPLNEASPISSLSNSSGRSEIFAFSSSARISAPDFPQTVPKLAAAFPFPFGLMSARTSRANTSSSPWPNTSVRSARSSSKAERRQSRTRFRKSLRLIKRNRPAMPPLDGISVLAT